MEILSQAVACKSFLSTATHLGWRGGGGPLWSGTQEPPHESTQPFVVSRLFSRKSWMWCPPVLTTTATTTFAGYVGVE